MPTAEAAFSIGTAKPMPTNTRCSDGLRMAVTMPTTAPSAVTSGPPELPGLAAASNWMRFVSTRLPCGERNSRFRPDTTPDETDGPIPNGKPTATTSSPGARSFVERRVAGARSSGTCCDLSTARSFSGCSEITVASDSSPSKNVTFTLSAPATTWRLVRMRPLSTMTTPVPMPCSMSPYPSGSSRRPCTRTTDGRTASAARDATDGSGFVSSV